MLEFWYKYFVISLTILVHKPGYSGRSQSIILMLMHWLLATSGSQQPWYWPCRINGPLSSTRKDFIHPCNFKCWEMIENIFLYISKYQRHTGVSVLKWFAVTGYSGPKVVGRLTYFSLPYLNVKAIGFFADGVWSLVYCSPLFGHKVCENHIWNRVNINHIMGSKTIISCVIEDFASMYVTRQTT